MVSCGISFKKFSHRALAVSYTHLTSGAIDLQALARGGLAGAAAGLARVADNGAAAAAVAAGLLAQMCIRDSSGSAPGWSNGPSARQPGYWLPGRPSHWCTKSQKT